MESETLITDYQRSTRERMLAAIGPVLWIATSYVDPGKWAVAVEGGARFGFDLSLVLLIINFAAVLCQYLSARVAIATGKNLAQVVIFFQHFFFSFEMLSFLLALFLIFFLVKFEIIEILRSP